MATPRNETALEVLPASKKKAQKCEWFPALIGWIHYFIVPDWLRAVGKNIFSAR